MKLTTMKTTLMAAIITIAFSANVSADHNSIWGAGWANMPNDIHNIRLEDDLDNTEFMETVSKGAGADTINRYADDEDSTTEAGQGVAGASFSGVPVATGGRDSGVGGRM